MEKQEFLDKLSQQLPLKYSYGMISINGQNVYFNEWVKSFADNIKVYDDKSLEQFIQTINKNVDGILVVLRKDKIRYINEFIDSLGTAFLKSIKTGPVSDLDIDEYLHSDQFIDNMLTKDLNVVVGPKEKSLDEFYDTLISNVYKAPTLDDKKELIDNMVEIYQFDQEMMDSIITIDETSYKVSEYINNILPSLMNDEMDINLGDDIKLISTYFEENIIPNIQKVEVQEEEIELPKAKNDEFDRTGENPNLVPEINKILNDGKLELTSSLPVMALSQDQKEALGRLEILTGDELITELKRVYNDILSIALNAKSVETLENVKGYYIEATNLTNKEELPILLRVLIETAKNTIDERITKLNSVDKVSVIDKTLNSLRDLRNEINTLDSVKKINDFKNKLTKVIMVIYDNRLANKEIEELINEIQLLTNSRSIAIINIEQSKSNAMTEAKLELDNHFDEIRRAMSSIELYTNNDEKLNVINRINSSLISLGELVKYFSRKRALTDEDTNKYNSRINAFTVALKEKMNELNPDVIYTQEKGNEVRLSGH